MSWIKYHLEYLKKWRQAASAIRRAVDELGIDADVYVIGGAAEDRLTVLSDVDVLICVKTSMALMELYKLKKKILFTAIDNHDLPWDYPVEIHIYNLDECSNILKHVKKKIIVV